MKKKGVSTIYTERYMNHEILSHDILDETLLGKFFKDISLRIKEIRKDLKMTQREFGETADVDRRYIAKIESSTQNPSFKVIRSISLKHKISPDWLCYGIGDRFLQIEHESFGDEIVIFKKLLDSGTSDEIDMIIKMIKKIL